MGSLAAYVKPTGFIGAFLAVIFMSLASTAVGGWSKGHQGHHGRHGHHGHGLGIHFGRRLGGHHYGYGGHHYGYGGQHYGYGRHRRHNPSHDLYSYDKHTSYPRYRSYSYSIGSYSKSTPEHASLSANTVYSSGGGALDDTSLGGWSLLSGGRTAAAQKAFGHQASANPEEGKPKVGYALAAAATGDLDKGIWAMRRALRIDPDALHYLDLDEQVETEVASLIGQYADYGDRRDQAFMKAALYYLLRQQGEAQSFIGLAMDRGDHSQSTENLRQLITRSTEESSS